MDRARAPIADRIPHVIASPNGDRTDDYYWLRDDTRTDEKVLAYLRAENAFTEECTAPTKHLEEELFSEIAARTKPDDSTVPIKKFGYLYYARFSAEQEYPVIARKKGSIESPEEVLIDGPTRAKGQAFFQVASTEPSPDSRYFAFTEDLVGRRQFVLRFLDTQTGALISDEVPNVQAAFAWLNDSRTVIYVEKDPVTLLGSRVRKHVLGTDAKDDPVVYEEADKSFYVGVSRAKSGKHILISLRSTLVSEVRWASAAGDAGHANGASAPLVFLPVSPREKNHEYNVDMLDDDNVFIHTNCGAKNFRIVRTSLATSADKTSWRDLVPHDPKVFIEDFDVFRDVIAVNERIDGQLKVLIVSLENKVKNAFIEADEKDFAMILASVPDPDEPVRYVYTSLATPRTVYDFDPRTNARTLRKREEVCGGYDPSHYTTELLWAPARDGKKIPVSIYYKRGTEKNGTAPMLQAAYGSYGMSSDPVFDSALLSLVDRGFVYALAHVRGGQELGREWYEDGKLLTKKNTFTDFVDVTRFLTREKYADESRVFAEGGSAGGLLMGAIANISPENYRGIVANVPFVDVVTTMLDDTIPLTTNEYDEWGNPSEKKFYDYMLSYSPYDNVNAQRYPAMLVITGLWDSQVQYYEPAKWVAKLRATQSKESGPLYFKVNMESGHGGKSGRYERFHDRALRFAFVLNEAGITR